MGWFNALAHAAVVNRWLHFSLLFYGNTPGYSSIYKMVCWSDQWDTFMGRLKANAVPLLSCSHCFSVSHSRACCLTKTKNTFPFELNLSIDYALIIYILSIKLSTHCNRIHFEFLKRIRFFSIFVSTESINIISNAARYSSILFLLFLNSHRLKNKSFSWSSMNWTFKHFSFFFFVFSYLINSFASFGAWLVPRINIYLDVLFGNLVQKTKQHFVFHPLTSNLKLAA